VRLEPGMAPPPAGQPPRGRPGDKRGGARQQRERNEEEKILRPSRRHVDAGPPPIKFGIGGPVSFASAEAGGSGSTIWNL